MIRKVLISKFARVSVALVFGLSAFALAQAAPAAGAPAAASPPNAPSAAAAAAAQIRSLRAGPCGLIKPLGSNRWSYGIKGLWVWVGTTAEAMKPCW